MLTYKIKCLGCGFTIPEEYLCDGDGNWYEVKYCPICGTRIEDADVIDDEDENDITEDESIYY